MNQRKMRFISLLLSLAVFFSLLSFSVLAADDVECLEESNGSEKRYTVQISSSASLKNSKIVAERARDVGYNVFVYHRSGSSRYKIMVGAFTSKSDAQELASEIISGPTVKGADVKDAYVETVKLSKSSAVAYSDPYSMDFPPAVMQSNPNDPSDDIPVIYGPDGTRKGVAIQVASSASESSCRTCIGRLRDAGYNAYIYQPKANSHYKIMIGFFDSKADASDVLEEVTSGPEVKGVKMSHGFLANVSLTKTQANLYSYCYW